MSTALRRLVAVGVGMAVMIATVATPAFAATKGGSKSCTGQTPIPVVMSRTTNVTTVYPVGYAGPTIYGGSVSTYATHYTNNNGQTSGSWSVSTGGSLDSANTYAYCEHV